jgi:hypothetical protein
VSRAEYETERTRGKQRLRELTAAARHAAASGV